MVGEGFIECLPGCRLGQGISPLRDSVSPSFYEASHMPTSGGSCTASGALPRLGRVILDKSLDLSVPHLLLRNGDRHSTL